MKIEDVFATSLNQGINGNYLIAAMHAYCADPDFAGFSIRVPGWKDDERKYDGKFHPSTHSLWPVRKLYLYLAAPQSLRAEPYGLPGVMAVTQGKIWHTFVQTICLAMGKLTAAELPIDVPETNIRGHVDGMLDNGEALEIKSINDFQIDVIVNEIILRQKKPQYWAQTQDYLAALGVETMRYLIIKPTHPFKMNEFLVHADPVYQQMRAAQYQLALEVFRAYPDPADGLRYLDPCCTAGSKQARECPVALACPIGRLR